MFTVEVLPKTLFRLKPGKGKRTAHKVLYFFYIHGSVIRHYILIRSNKIQQMQVFIYCKITLHVSGVYRTHHQEYI